MTRIALILAAVLILFIGAHSYAVRTDCNSATRHINEGSKPQEVEDLLSEIRKTRSIFIDPFLFMTDPASGREIWNGLQKAFPLIPKVRAAVNLSHAEQTGIDKALVEEVLKQAKLQLDNNANGKGDPTGLDGAYVALNTLNEVFIRERASQSAPPQPPPPQQGQGKDKKQEKQQQQKPQEPEFPDSVDHYKPHNKDTDPQSTPGGENQPKVSIAEINEPDIQYFKTDHYQIVGPSGWHKIPVTESIRVQHASGATHILKVRPGKKKGVPLPVPVPIGFVPLEINNKNGKVEKDPSGNYKFTSNVEELEIPLVPQGKAARPLSPQEKEIYTTPTGFQFEAWPKWLQKDVDLLKSEYESGKLDDHGVASVLENLIQSKFKYRVDKDDMQDIASLVNGGAFQCDIAATLAVSLLRDQFKIPARIAAGDFGHENPRTPLSSHVVQPAQRHAWFEVPDSNGNWKGFDPTPIEKDREVKQETSDKKNDFNPIGEKKEDKQQDQQKENEGEPSNSKKDSTEQKGDKAPEKKDHATEAKSTKDLIDMLKKEIQEKKAKAEKDAQKKKGEKGEEGEKDKKNDEKSKEEQDAEHDKYDQSSPSDKKTRPKHTIDSIDEANPFIRAFLKQAFKWALDEQLDTHTKMERLNILKGAMGSQAASNSTFRQAREILNESTSLFQGEEPAFDGWMNRIVQEAPRRPLNETADDIVQLKRQIEWTLQFKEGGERVPLEKALKALKDIQSAMGRIRHPESKNIRIVEELMENLPGNISRNILRNDGKYLGGVGTGPNQATIELAKKLTSGKDPFLKDMRISSALGPHTNFLVDPVFLPSQGEQRTVLRDPMPQRKPKGLQITSDPRDKRLGLLKLNPRISDRAAMLTGQMAVLTQNKYVKTPAGFKDTDPEKATIIAIDTSGSMKGEKIDFQSHYVAALVDRALSDINPGGKAKHRVYIIPFSDKVGEPIEVTSAKEALAIVEGKKGSYKNANGGTNIQKVLEKAASTVKEAGESSDKALSRATILLASDGGSEVDKAKIENAFRDARKTKKHGDNKDLMLNFGFIAIGETNTDLIELAQESKKLGADKGMYLEFDNDTIDKFLTEARRPPEPVNDFWTETKYTDAPLDVRTSFGRLAQANADYRLALSKEKSAASANTLDWLKAKSQENVEERQERREGSKKAVLWRLRDVLDLFGSYFQPNERKGLLESTLKNFKNEVPGEPKTWDMSEISQIRHLLFWPETGQAVNPMYRNGATEP